LTDDQDIVVFVIADQLAGQRPLMRVFSVASTPVDNRKVFSNKAFEVASRSEKPRLLQMALMSTGLTIS